MFVVRAVAAAGLLAAVSGTASAATSQPIAADGLSWQWGDGDRRYYVETEVNLPTFMWFVADRVEEVRVVAFQMRAVLDCSVGHDRRKATELRCTFEDVGLVAAATPADQGMLDTVLQEIDHKLSNAWVQLVLKDDGRVQAVDLEAIDKQDINRRTNLMDENLRLVVSRAMAGFDLQLPKSTAANGPWAQYSSTLMMIPSDVGSASGTQIAHRLIEEVGDQSVVIESAGKATIESAGLEDNFYEAEMRGMAVFDTGSGNLRERLWNVTAHPSAGSLLAEGYRGITYTQWGRLVLLEDGATRDVGDTAEVGPPGDTASTLQMWSPMGLSGASVGAPLHKL